MKRPPLRTLYFVCTLIGGAAIAPRVEPSPTFAAGAVGRPGPDTGEPSLVRGPDGTVHLTYVGPGRSDGERTLWLATLAPGAGSWGEPRAIVRTHRLMENWADFATLAVGTDGTLWAQWYQRNDGAGNDGYGGWMARSADQGITWTSPAPLGQEFVSLAPLPGGRMLAVWLESLRSPSASAGAHPPDHPALGAPGMRLQARLLGPEGATLADWVVDPDVCTCCQTTLARLPGDRVAVAYRGHTADEIRDNLVAWFDGQRWTRPAIVHADGWKISACPVNGPAADAHEGRMAIAWFTAANNTARVQAKQSRDGGVTFGPSLPVDLGRPIGRIDLVVLEDGSTVVSWMEGRSDKNAGGLYVRRLFPDGAMSAPRLLAPTSTSRASGFPRMAARDGEALPVVISWTEATPVDPADATSATSTAVHVAEFAARQLVAAPLAPDAPPAPVTFIRGHALQLLEVCAAPAPLHEKRP